VETEPELAATEGEIELPEKGRLVSAHLPGSVWQVVVKVGDVVAEGDKLFILESMKMETAITAPCAGTVQRILVAAGKTVEAGQGLAVLIES
jgi:urea carboxylase